MELLTVVSTFVTLVVTGVHQGKVIAGYKLLGTCEDLVVKLVRNDIITGQQSDKDASDGSTVVDQSETIVVSIDHLIVGEEGSEVR